MSIREQIGKTVHEMLTANPGGVRFAALFEAVKRKLPQVKESTISTQISDLPDWDQRVVRPARGLYILAGEVATPPPVTSASTPAAPACQESDFYEPFAKYLQAEMKEVTVASVLGGSAMGRKWGTPDVVGVYKKTASQLIQFDPEIVAAEIKVDPSQWIVAFGQAAAYRLFAHKSFIVMPKTLDPEEQNRLVSLCSLFGIGLVFFNLDPNRPEFHPRVQAMRSQPNMYYVNEFAERIKESDRKTYDKLF